MGMLAYWRWHSGQWPPIAIGRGTSRLLPLACCIGVLLPVRWDMQTPQTSQHSWPPRWPLAIDRHASMPACHNQNAGMLGSTQAAQTDQHFWPPPLLAGHRPALQEGAKNSGVSVLLACTLAYQHPSCWHAGMLACWHAGMLVDGQPAREGGKNAGLSVLLGCTPACQHPQLLACWHAGMLVDGQPAREGAKNAVCAVGMHPSMPAPKLLACCNAGVHPSSADRPAYQHAAC